MTILIMVTILATLYFLLFIDVVLFAYLLNKYSNRYGIHAWLSSPRSFVCGAPFGAILVCICDGFVGVYHLLVRKSNKENV